jgi:hypothetical protein
MSSGKTRYGRRTECPCHRKKMRFYPIVNESKTPTGGGKCWSTACGQRFFPPPRPAGDLKSNNNSTISRREHIYHNANGLPHMCVTIFKRSDGEKRVLTYRWDGSQWQIGVEGVDRLLYKMPQVIERVAQGGTICICEGEKDCDSAESIGITATCNPFGATKWKDEMSQVLAGARVTIIPDLDGPGWEHAKVVERSLREAGVATIGILDLRTLMPDLPETSDLSDYLHYGGDPEKLRAAIEAVLADEVEEQEATLQLPHINWELLPEPLAQITKPVENELHRLALLMASVTTLGSIMTTVTTPYAGKRYWPTLYYFLCGPPGSGKSCIEPALYLVEDIDREIRQGSKLKFDEFRRKQQALSRANGESEESPPEKPERKLLIVPADSTAPVLVRAICNNESVLVFDTEADSLQNALRTETGDASSALRKAWHGERVDQARVGDDLHVSTDHPRLSMVLSGTPDQILGLIKHVASGLASRFRFTMLPRQRTFANPFRLGSQDVRSIAHKLKMSIRNLWSYMKPYDQQIEFSVVLTDEQQQQLISQLKPLYEDVIEDVDAGTTLRTGIVIVRIATVLTVLRHWFGNGSLKHEMIVTDIDFQTALELSEFLRLHTEYVVQSLKQQSTDPVLRPISNNKHKWLDELPYEFTTIEAVNIGNRYSIGKSTVYAMLKLEKYFQKIRHGHYIKKDIITTKGP